MSLRNDSLTIERATDALVQIAQECHLKLKIVVVIDRYFHSIAQGSI